MKKIISKISFLTVAIVLIAVQALNISATTYITDGSDFYIAFDCNQDGLVDARDLVNIKKSIANNNTTSAQDVNGSGTVDAEDLIYCRYYLLGIDGSAWTEAF